MKYYEVFKRKLIYVYAIPDDAHKGLLKIGETTIDVDSQTNQLALERAAHKRIKQSLNTGGVAYKLRHVELAVTDKGKAFGDREVHKVLKNSGIEKESPEGTTAREWFRIDLPTAKRAIQAVKRGENFIWVSLEKIREEIVLRPEQDEVIDKTVAYFQHDNRFLWNAKMRFGKTLCALEVVRRMNFGKTIIVTHRPVVDKNWFTEYKNVFRDDRDFLYGSRKRGDSLKTLQARGKRGKNFIYFASMQDLRGSKDFKKADTPDIFDKNSEVFGETWDFVIVDEGHEGTQTTIGDAVIKKLLKRKTKILWLSGTPFNLVDDFTDENSFTWDYVREQDAKLNWYRDHGDDSNPYANLPQMNIYTYNLGNLLGKEFVDTDDVIFSFNEFFRTNDKGNFVHAADVKSFLDLLVKADDNNYPFSRQNWRDMFRHTLWIVPGVREGKALSRLLKRHRVFGNDNFGIANVAGDGDEDIPYKDALKLVQKTIAENDYSITISCGKLTTGVTVPEWTAVFMLAGGITATSATSYLQTIFRVQNPYNDVGGSKQNAYVFDFAPDRALRMVTKFVKVSARAGKATASDIDRLDDLLTFCPVIAVEGSQMNELDAKKLLRRLKDAQIERIVKNGFADNNLYSDKLYNLTDEDWQNLNGAKKFVGVSKDPTDKIIVNEQGVTGKQPAAKSARTPEQKALDKKRNDRRKAISILRQVSIRMPLLIYGADVPLNEDITVKRFSELVDDASWAEFMPAGFTREMFNNLMPYYDPVNFVESAKHVRELAKKADELTPTERVKKIAALFATFKNPDKETVLTPWKVVNLHMTEVFGGWNFFADDPPQLVPTEIFRANSHILEINSKTGLYPLFVAYSIYRARLGNTNEDKTDLGELRRIWDMTVAENVFVICKTPMAKTITRRTLTGYRGSTVNAECYDGLIDTLKTDRKKFIRDVTTEKFWHKGVGTMFFDAVVGNPPYQNIAANTSDEPVYNHFIETAFKLADRVSLVHPARCLFNAGKTPKDFNKWLLTNKQVRVVHYESDSTKFFPTSDIKGGVVITEFDKTKTFEPIGTFIPFDELRSVHQKVCVDNKDFRSLSEIIYPPETFHFTPKFHADNPTAAKLLSDGHADDLTTNVFDKLPQIFFDDKPTDGHEYIRIYGLQKMSRVYKWIRRDYVRNETNLDNFKVMLPKSNGSGAIGEVLSTPLVGLPLVGCTQTFITVGAFDTEAEAEACLKYIKTKFCRALLGVLKVTQHNPPSTWAKVPLQDFTSHGDIDWTQTVAQIDEQLYRKYGLTQTEIDFIESHVKEML